MKVKQLIEMLQKYADPESTAYLTTESSTYDFSGVSFDDNNDVELYAACEDREA